MLLSQLSKSLSQRSTWRRAILQTLPWSQGGISEAVETFRLCEALLVGASGPEETSQVLDGVLSYEETASSAPAWLSDRWSIWPGSVRAALVEHGVVAPTDPRCLADGTPDVIIKALSQISGVLEPPMAQRLRALLLHHSGQVRSAVSIHLAKARAPSAVGEVSPSESARVVALPSAILARSALERIRAAYVLDEPETIPSHAEGIPPEDVDAARQALISGLILPDVAARRASVEGLARLGLPEDIPALMSAARRVRGLETIVVAAIRAIGGPVDPGALAELFHRRLKWADDEAVDHYVALAGAEAEGELSAAVQTRFNPPARVGAARALARHGFKSAIFSLRTRSLTDTSQEARQAAMQALESLSGTELSKHQVAGYEVLHVPIDQLDHAAERARKGGRHAIAGLRYCLAKGSWRRRVVACEVLGALTGSEAQTVLVEAMLDSDEDVRLAARSALAEQGWAPHDKRTFTLAAIAERKYDRLLLHQQRIDTEVLERCLALGGYVFRTEIVALLARLEELGHWHPTSDVTPALFLTALDVEQALGLEGGLRATLRAIDRTWQLHPHRALLGHGLVGLPSNVVAECDSEGEVGWRAREAVCFALGESSDKAAVTELGKRVLDPDEDVRTAALDGLVRIGTPEAAQALSEGARSPFQEDAHGVAEALAAIGAAALPTVRRLAESEWWEERRAATIALLRWRGAPQDAVDIALPLAVDPEYRVAETARKALLLQGLQPSRGVVHDTLQRTHIITLSGIEPWLGLDVAHRFEDDNAGQAFDAALQASPNESLVHRVCLAGHLKRHDLRPWLTQLASGQTTGHVGLRLAATEAMRLLEAESCHLCEGRGSTPCVACAGDGETRCSACSGEGTMKIDCPEPTCTARERTRGIHSATCKVCRGRGTVVRACDCVNGFVPCVVCHGGGRSLCLGCNGSGKMSLSGAPALQSDEKKPSDV